MASINTEHYINGVLAGDRRLLAKAITLVESALPDHQDQARQIVQILQPRSGKAIRLGITGVPGVGKSTFVESLGMYLVENHHRLAVLAVDPSSSRSGGSIMADKTRMEKLSVEKAAFIRPSPAGGTLGGVARKTRETMLLCEAAGFDVIIVETVGVGQSETTVASMVDFFLVLMLAGAGDELQGIKKGILELADAVAINKADGDNVEKARMAGKKYEAALHLLSPEIPDWSPPVLTCSGLTTSGIDRIWQTVLDHRKRMAQNGMLERKRREQALAWMWDLLEEGLKQRFYKHPHVKSQMSRIEREVERGTLSPMAAVHTLLFSLDNGTAL
jgi:LAO/AO transport system kinase